MFPGALSSSHMSLTDRDSKERITQILLHLPPNSFDQVAVLFLALL